VNIRKNCMLFSDTFILQTKLKSNEIFLILKNNTADRGITNCYTTKNKIFEGAISMEKFSLNLIENTRTTFIPIIDGLLISSNEEVTIYHLRIRQKRFVVALILFYLFISITVPVILLFASLYKKIEISPSNIIFICLVFIMTGYFSIMNHHKLPREKSKEMIIKILDGKVG